MKDRLMDYLYGEMSDSERQAFESWLATQPEVGRELEALRQTRQQLQAAAPIAPVVRLAPPPRLRTGGWQRVAAVALLVLALWAFNFRADYHDGRLSLQFGATAAPEPDLPMQPLPNPMPLPSTAEEDTAWRIAMLARYDSLESLLARRDAAWENRLANLSRQPVRLPDSLYIRQWQQHILPELTAFAHQLRLQQRESLQDAIDETWVRWAQVRESDLYRIDQALLEMQQRNAYTLQEPPMRAH